MFIDVPARVNRCTPLVCAAANIDADVAGLRGLERGVASVDVGTGAGAGLDDGTRAGLALGRGLGRDCERVRDGVVARVDFGVGVGLGLGFCGVCAGFFGEGGLVTTIASPALLLVLD